MGAGFHPFWNEEKWGGLGGLGQYNSPCFQMFIYEGLTGFLFGGVKRVYFDNLGGE